MEQNNYHSSITAGITPDEAYAHIANVQGWWARNFTGNASATGDTFTVRFGDTYVEFEIRDAKPGQSVNWYVTGCHLPWLTDKTEWNGTTVNWVITPDAGGVRIDMTHIGLVPEVECFEACQKGWDGHVNGSLHNLMTEGKGQPQ